MPRALLHHTPFGNGQEVDLPYMELTLLRFYHVLSKCFIPIRPMYKSHPEPIRHFQLSHGTGPHVLGKLVVGPRGDHILFPTFYSPLALTNNIQVAFPLLELS